MKKHFLYFFLIFQIFILSSLLAFAFADIATATPGYYSIVGSYGDPGAVKLFPGLSAEKIFFFPPNSGYWWRACVFCYGASGTIEITYHESAGVLVIDDVNCY